MAAITNRRPPLMSQRRVGWISKQIASYGILLAAAMCVLVPFAIIVSTSFKKSVNIEAFPPDWIPAHANLQNYINLLNGYPFLTWWFNSAFVTSAIVILKVTIDSMAGYAFAKGRFIGREAIFAVLLTTMMVPLAVTLIPTFLVARTLNLVDSYPGLILPALANPFGIFLLRQYFETVPTELIDAAKVDGAGELQAFARVVVPVSTPGILAVASLELATAWVSFLWPLVIVQSAGLQLLTVGVPSMAGLWQVDWGLISAASVLSIAPIVGLFTLGHRYFVEGVRMGALKG